MRLIDADAVLERVKPYSESDVEWVCTGETVKRLIRDAIDNAPTIDAVEVVRCKDCKHHREINEREREYLRPDVLICTNAEFIDDGWNPVWPDDFCSYGERSIE